MESAQLPSARPRPDLPAEPADRLLDGLAIAGLIVLLALPTAYFSDLPDSVPTGFDFYGNARGYGSRSIVWILPALGALIFAFMFRLRNRPHRYNFPVKLTPENAARQYRLGSRLVRGVLTWVMWLFAFIVWNTIQVALGSRGYMGHAFTGVFLAGNFLIIFLYWRAAMKR
jgi:uncharacterized membrane protein